MRSAGTELLAEGCWLHRLWVRAPVPLSPRYLCLFRIGGSYQGAWCQRFVIPLYIRKQNLSL